MRSELYISIAGLPVRLCIDAPDIGAFGILDEYLMDTVPTSVSHTYRLRCVTRLSPPEGICVYSDPSKLVYSSGDCEIRFVGTVADSPDHAYLRVSRCGQESDVEYRGDRITAKIILTALCGEHLIVAHGGFLLHASCIRRAGYGDGVLFTAPSGTGKSTQASLWCTHRDAEFINGDRISVFPVPSSQPQARGIPFAGSSGVAKNTALMLRAIVYLKQSPTNSVRFLRGSAAFRAIWEGCSVNVWNRSDVESCTESVMRTIAQIPVLELSCTPDICAVEALESVLL
ncbi:MAG: hypothetical protein J6S76_03480 [Clostridia bacterium]|nr:hypothetical protein [Clostridia bacterium]